MVTLTHVCRGWREIFISCSSLWTCLDCENADKTRVYLERSKSSPITLWLDRGERLRADDPFFEIDPRAISHLKYLDIQGSTENLQDITRQLSHPAPLLEKLTIEIDNIGHGPRRGPVALTALFNGDLSSLRELTLHCIHTSLPWRNMVNLTSFLLAYPPPGEISTVQLLDFFDSAPHLREVELNGVSRPRRSKWTVGIPDVSKELINLRGSTDLPLARPPFDPDRCELDNRVGTASPPD